MGHLELNPENGARKPCQGWPDWFYSLIGGAGRGDVAASRSHH
jgi:hypothetical protein